MSTTEGGMVFSYPAFCRLSRQFDIRIRARWVPPFAPVHFAMVCAKDDGELVTYLFHDKARDEWIAMEDDEDGTLEALFA